MIGSRLGVYEITAKLGEGGMGEVYRAHDPKLSRDVAVKVLPKHLAADSDALARFEREAKTVAGLSHPNILAIFDFGRDGEIAFAAMELLEGETLGERLRTGALPVRKALEIASQVALGLAAAHERGVVHRDLKPDNLFLARDGQVKILDFGLARQTEVLDSKSQLVAAPTQGPATEVGTVLGTVGYMAPEQVRGVRADHRADIFSLGVVLFEMLTGKRAFLRESAVETMTAIVREEPAELESLGEKFSPSLVRLVQHCLEKRPEDRFQSARDLAFDLRSLAAGGSGSDRSARLPAGIVSASPRRGLAAAALLGLGAVLGASIMAWVGRGGGGSAEESSSVPRLSFRQLTRTPGGEGQPSISPDGESFVFVKRDGADSNLFLQRVDGTKAIALTADCAQEDFDPAFSHDGRWIAYRSDCDGGGIFVMGATGESRRRVVDFGHWPAWSPDGRELALVTERLESPTSRNTVSELWAVNVESGARRRVTEVDAMGPTWSPDGKRIAFWGLRGEGFQRDLWTVLADGSAPAAGEVVELLDDPAVDWAPVYSRDGRWLYFASTRGGTFNLWRMAIDPSTGTRGGEPQPLTAPSSWAGPFSVSADGRRLVFTDRNIGTSIQGAPFDAARRRLSGTPRDLFSGSFELREQKISPDGERLLFTNEDPPQHLHLVRRDGTAYRQLTTGEDRNRQGEWSPDGQWIVFQTSRGGAAMAVVRPDGSGWTSFGADRGLSTPRWSPDGNTIASFDQERGLLFDVRNGFDAPVRKELPPLPGADAFWPTAWSPDGTLLAGRAALQGRIDDVVMYSLAEGSYRTLARTSGARNDFSVVFVGKRDLVYSDDKRLWLVDVGSGEKRVLYEPPAGKRAVSLSSTPDGSWLTWIERADESDIWLMTIDEAPQLAR